MSMKNYSDTIGNRTRYLSALSAVLQPTAPPRAPLSNVLDLIPEFLISFFYGYYRRARLDPETLV